MQRNAWRTGSDYLHLAIREQVRMNTLQGVLGLVGRKFALIAGSDGQKHAKREIGPQQIN